MAVKGEINERLLDLLEKQVERTGPRENPNYKANSPTLKENGEPWAKDLKCDVYFGPIHLNRTPLLKSEVEALNRLMPIEDGFVSKTDRTKIPTRVIAKKDATGRYERITIAFKSDEKNLNLTLPALEDIALELALQAEGVAA